MEGIIQFAENPFRRAPIDASSILVGDYAAYYSGIEYHPLSIRNNEIRLLRIQPATSQADRIVCHLEHTPLNHPRDNTFGYVALSYYWGDGASGTHLILAGYEVQVTMNLYRALWQLRAGGHYLVWADGLCINQADLEERSEQVLRMAAIYRSASLVISYLDSQDPMDDSRSVKVLELNSQARRKSAEMDRYLQQKRNRIKKRETSVQGGFLFPRIVAKETPQKPKILPKPSKLQITEEEYEALVKLLEHEYWMRAWIIQEISVNPNLKIIWCGCEISLDELMVTVQQLAHIDRIGKSQARHHIEQLSRIRKSQLALQPLALIDALRMCYQARATIYRDRVFALLSLTHDGPSLVPLPSYEVPTNKLCRDMTVRIIQATGNLEMVVAKKHEVNTWYPNWFSSQTFAPSPAATGVEGLRSLIEYPIDRYYRASGNRRADCVPSLLDSGISFKGVVIGKVSAISPTLEESKASNLDRSRITVSRVWKAGGSTEANLRTKYLAAAGVLRWLLVGVTSDPPNDRHSTYHDTLKRLSRLLHRRAATIEQYAPDLIQWMNCCEQQNFKVNREPFVAHFSERNEKGAPIPNMLPKTCRVIQKNLEAGMRLGSLNEGSLGWFHKNTQVRDRVFIFLGSAMPCVVRPSGHDHGFTIVGPCIVHGAMDGLKLESVMNQVEYVRVS
ncbi:heterokaryon incompatibility protein-domain-containing protein [Xylaria arbuscula]|nr:heterokaryon incompatibility protein-domain-containing protein [Xylaria arbuscula]